MAYIVRPVLIREESASLTAFLSAHLSPEATGERYDWLYCRNPAGIARAWMARENGTDRIIGVSAAFPRKICCRGKEVPGYVLGDFCIHPDYRSLGPAMALQRRTIEDLSNDGVRFVFDFPSTSMQAIYKRLRIEPRESVIRFAKPLRADRQIQKRVSTGAAGAALAVAANAALRLRDAGLARSSEWTITASTTRCGEEFTAAFHRWAPRMGTCAERSAEYLNWRFLEHPQRRYQILNARKQGNLCGYLIFHGEGEDATIVDLFAEKEEVSKALLTEAVASTRNQGFQTLSAPLLSSHWGGKTFEDCGFQLRESSPVVALNYGEAQPAAELYLMHGDRES